MIVSYADKLGREMGLNGVWGNLGVASSALVTGVIGQYLGWRWAFIIPGIVTMLIGIAFARTVVHERPLRLQAGGGAGAGGERGHVAGDPGAVDRGDRDLDHLQCRDGGAAESCLPSGSPT